MKRGQLAVETLMIYGVAILIVMLAIGALIGFGVLDLSGILPDTCNIPGASMTCDEYFLSKTDGLNLELTNNLGKNLEELQLLRVYAADINDEGLLASECGNISGNFSIDSTHNVGKTTETSLLLLDGQKTFIIASDCVPIESLKAGRKIKLNFEIKYRTSGSNLDITKAGKMTVTVVQ